jgi:hypothetical protein
METEPGRMVPGEGVRDSRRCSCSALTYDGNKAAIGYAIVSSKRESSQEAAERIPAVQFASMPRMGIHTHTRSYVSVSSLTFQNGWSRGAIVMSNLVYSSSLLYLASEAAGCLGDDGKVVKNCDKHVYGFVPAALIANIAVVSGILSAFFMPICGAIVDYTSHRWTVGVFVTTLMIIVQILQIGTVAKTWFAMLILQALAGFFYQIEVMAISAYLPDMAREVGEKTMTKCKFGEEESHSMISFVSSVYTIHFNACPGDCSPIRFHHGTIHCTASISRSGYGRHFRSEFHRWGV